jgi:CheY-like chemotaxis protein
MSNEKLVQQNESKTILVVEDSPVQAFAMIQLLEQHGLNVLCAPDGLSGVALAKKSHPDLIILDIQMPGMDGLEACHIIKQDPAFQEVPIIFVTAHSEPDNLRRGIYEGAIDFIPKDAFSDLVLLRTLKELNIILGVEDVDAE